ncbi:hypothetical protein [Arthrobacter terrae]|nr:hypothetical protein [Arthrobacter terrae]
MTENTPTDLGPEIAAVLTSLASNIKTERHGTEAFRRMETSENVGQVLRHLHSAAGNAIVDAFDVLRDKFGLAGTHELYDYLHTVPYRWKLYEEAYRAETYVGCVDRTVSRLASEVRTSGGLQERAPQRDPRFQVAGLAVDGSGNPIGETAATDALILADRFDDSRRIQRLSSDTGAITARITDNNGPGASPEQVRAMVRLVLCTAADIAREQDGLEL